MNKINKSTIIEKYNYFYIITIILLLLNYIFWVWKFNFFTINVHNFIWKIFANTFKNVGFTFSAKCLENSLNEKPKDIKITIGKVIKDIKDDQNFKEKINNIIEEHKEEIYFEVEELIRFNDGDLLLALHDATINVIGEKQNNNFWNLQIDITDKYDFTDYKEINQIISGNKNLLEKLGNVANNIAMISTSCNVIKEYNIEIKFNMNSAEI